MCSLPNLTLIGANDEEEEEEERRAEIEVHQHNSELGGAKPSSVLVFRRDSLLSSSSAARDSLAAFAGLSITPVYTPTQLLKNLALLSLSSSLTFGSLFAIQSLQSSLPSPSLASAGVAASAGLYTAAAVSSLVAPAVVELASPTWTLGAGGVLVGVGLAAHWAPSLVSLVATSVAVGVGLGPWLSARSTLLVTFASKYAFVTETTRDKALRRFVHVFHVVLQLGHVLGSLGTAFLLSSSSEPNFPHHQVYQPGEVAYHPNQDPPYHCRPNDCHRQQQQNDQQQTAQVVPMSSDGDDEAVGLLSSPPQLPASLVLASVACALVGAALAGCMDRVEVHVHQDPLERPTAVVLLSNVAGSLADKKLWLCLPLALGVGLEQGFLAADFTKSYVSCALGLPAVGWCLLSAGITQTLSAMLVPLLAKHVQRLAILGASLTFQMGLLAVLWLWRPASDDAAVFYVIAAGWGLCHSVWEAMALAMLATLYSDVWHAPCAVYSVAHNAGLSLAFAAHLHLCNRTKILVLATSLPVAVLLFSLLEVRVQRYRKMRETTALL